MWVVKKANKGAARLGFALLMETENWVVLERKVWVMLLCFLGKKQRRDDEEDAYDYNENED